MSQGMISFHKQTQGVVPVRHKLDPAFPLPASKVSIDGADFARRRGKAASRRLQPDLHALTHTLAAHINTTRTQAAPLANLQVT